MKAKINEHNENFPFQTKPYVENIHSTFDTFCPNLILLSKLLNVLKYTITKL